MRERMWSEDDNGELWLGDDAALDNPHLILANPPRRRGMPPQLAKYWREKYAGGKKKPGEKKRRAGSPRKALRNPPAAWVQTARRSAGRRAASFMGAFPDAITVGGVAAGFVVPGMVFGQIRRFLPASVTSLPMDSSDTTRSAIGYWAVKLGVAVLPPIGVRKFISAKIGNSMLVGGIVSFAVDLLRYYAPSFMAGMAGQPMLGYYTPGPIPALDAGPVRRSVGQGMGMYTPDAYPAAGRPSRMVATTPDRFNPGSRF